MDMQLFDNEVGFPNDWVIRVGCQRVPRKTVEKIIALVEQKRVGQVRLADGFVINISPKEVTLNSGDDLGHEEPLSKVHAIARELRRRGLISAAPEPTIRTGHPQRPRHHKEETLPCRAHKRIE